jgi:HK97 family phage major capsid protein
MKAFGGLAAVVDEITTDTGNNLPWLTEGDDTSNRAEQVDEGGTFTGGADLSYGKASLGAYSYMAGGAGGNPLRLSRELVQDSAFDIVGRVSNKLGERGARLRAQLLVSGTGVNQPQGIVTGRTGVQTAANNALTYADLLGYVHALDPGVPQVRATAGGRSTTRSCRRCAGSWTRTVARCSRVRRERRDRRPHPNGHDAARLPGHDRPGLLELHEQRRRR